MFKEQYHLLAQWLHFHPQWGGIAAFAIAFSESIAIIGSIIPGSVTMTAIGILAGSGVLPIWTTIIWAISGAFLGDGLSFMFGRHFKHHIKNIWPFSRYPKILTAGQVFFLKHGGKSIFIGRFVGPVRAMVPIVAGTFEMKPLKYFSISIFSAIGWAPVYMLPGILLGAISLEMPTDLAAELIICVLLLLVTLWLVIWLIKKIYNKTHNYFAYILDKKWIKWSTEPSKSWICVLLKRSDRPYKHGQLLIASVGVLFAIAFGLVFLDVYFHGTIININQIVYHIVRGFRTPILDKAMVFISTLGYKKVLLPIALVIFLWLLGTKKYFAAIHWGIATLVTTGAIFVLKHIYFSARPSGIVAQQITSSFPSGHTALALVIYGLAAFFISKNAAKSFRKFVYIITTGLCLLIILSRLYLCAHWVTDILGAITLAITIICITVISYRRKPSPDISSKWFLTIFLIALCISCAINLHKNFINDWNNSKLHWPTHEVSIDRWWNNKQIPTIPLYRINRLGHPAEILNIQWAGSLDLIKQTLKARNWKDLHTKRYLDVLKQIASQSDIAKYHPFLAKLYDDQHPVLELIHHPNLKKPALILRLWRSNILLTPRFKPLWIGTVSYNVPNKNLLFFIHTTNTIPVAKLRKTTSPFLKNYSWQVKNIDKTSVPPELLKHQPKAQIILIKPKDW
jgi:membrane protein DedA with SNARE-associated domain/membrane-associated phospholipid phosphatase